MKKSYTLHKQILLFFVLVLGLFLFQNQNPLVYSSGLEFNPEKFPEPKIPKDNPQTKAGIELGRLLFYDKMLSGNNEQSCASCHQQHLAFTDGKKLAIGTNGDTVLRNAMSLVNLAWGKNFFWDGRVNTLEELILQPITEPMEMAQDSLELLHELKAHKYYPKLFEKAFPNENISTKTLSKAIAQFLRSLIAEAQDLPDSLSANYQLNTNNSPDAKTLPYEFFGLDPEDIVLTKSDTVVYQNFKQQTFSTEMQDEASFQGMYFRLGMMCTPCHTGESFGGELMANNLLDPKQTEMFKVPSLLNVLQTAPYMRDGRFISVDEVLEHYDRHISELHLHNPDLKIPAIPNLITDYDKQHFREFLEIFTDSNFLENKEWSDPFASETFSWEKL